MIYAQNDKITMLRKAGRDLINKLSNYIGDDVPSNLQNLSDNVFLVESNTKGNEGINEVLYTRSNNIVVSHSFVHQSQFKDISDNTFFVFRDSITSCIGAWDHTDNGLIYWYYNNKTISLSIPSNKNGVWYTAVMMYE